MDLAIRRSSRKRGLVALMVPAVIAAVLVAAAPASAAVTCVFSGAIVTVTTTANGDTATISRGTGGNANKILVNGVQCGTATVTTTDTIRVKGATGDQTVVI